MSEQTAFQGGQLINGRYGDDYILGIGGVGENLVVPNLNAKFIDIVTGVSTRVQWIFVIGRGLENQLT